MVKKLISVHTIHVTLKAGKNADPIAKTSSVPPVVKEIPGNVVFTPRTEQEYNEYLKMGAARLPGPEESLERFRTLELDDNDNDMGYIAPGLSDEEIAAKEAKEAAAQKKRDDAAAKVRADNLAKVKAQAAPGKGRGKPADAPKQEDDAAVTGDQGDGSGEGSGEENDVV